MRLDALFPLVLPEVSGCPQPTLALHIALAAQRFCVETGAWLVMTDAQRTQAGLHEYDLDPEMGAQVVRVRDVWLDGALLPPMAAAQAQAQVDQAGVLGYTHYDERQVLHLVGQPRTGQLLQMRLVMAPKSNATMLPDELCLRHQVDIAHGAKASLMVMPNQVWSNPQLGAYHAQMFYSAIADARINAVKDGVDRPLVVSKRRFV